MKAGEEAVVEVAFVPVHPEAVPFTPSLLDVVTKYRSSCDETLSVLEETMRAGAFGLKEGGCEWCAVKAACRRKHVPTLERLRAIGELRDYRDLEGKSTAALDLSAVRAKKGGGP